MRERKKGGFFFFLPFFFSFRRPFSFFFYPFFFSFAPFPNFLKTEDRSPSLRDLFLLLSPFSFLGTDFPFLPAGGLSFLPLSPAPFPFFPFFFFLSVVFCRIN